MSASFVGSGEILPEIDDYLQPDEVAIIISKKRYEKRYHVAFIAKESILSDSDIALRYLSKAKYSLERYEQDAFVANPLGG